MPALAANADSLFRLKALLGGGCINEYEFEEEEAKLRRVELLPPVGPSDAGIAAVFAAMTKSGCRGSRNSPTP